MHAGAALALAAAHLAPGAGAAGDAGLDSLTLAAAPPALQVTFVTEADLLPAAPPEVPSLAPPAPLLAAPAMADAAPPVPEADTAPSPPPPSVLATLSGPQDTAPPLPEAPPPPPPFVAHGTTEAQAPGTSLSPPPPAARRPAAPALLSRSPAPELPDPAPVAKPPAETPAETRSAAAAPAEAAPASRAAGQGGGAAAGDAGAARDPGPSSARVAELKQAWGAKVRARVEARKAYPQAAGGAAGTVKVRITLSPAGRLIDVSVTSSSGNPALDSAAVKAVRAARFPAAPRGLEEASYSFTLPIRYAP